MWNGRDCYPFTQSGFLESIPGDSLPLLSLAASCLHCLLPGGDFGKLFIPGIGLYVEV